MNRERLGWIIENLENEEKWEKESKGKDNLKFDMKVWTCGTARCAFGTLYDDPRAQKLGLQFKQWLNTGTLFPLYDGFWGFVAVMRFLGISFEQAHRVFDSVSYKGNRATRADVIERLNKLKEGKKV